MDVNWDAIGAIGEVAGAVGVVATLLYLSQQIRQNTKATRSATAQDMTNNWVAINLEMSRNKAVTEDVDFDRPPEEVQLVLSFWRSMFHQWSNCHYQYHYGLLEELLFATTSEEIKTYAADATVGPNLRNAWAATRFIYNAEFQEYVDTLIRETPIVNDALFNENVE